MADLTIDYGKFAATPLVRTPFDYTVVPGFVRRKAAMAASESFPGPDLHGVLPAPSQAKTDAFGQLLAALRAPLTTLWFAEKFGLALATETLMVTLRSRCRQRNGAIHTDSPQKIGHRTDLWVTRGTVVSPQCAATFDGPSSAGRVRQASWDCRTMPYCNGRSLGAARGPSPGIALSKSLWKTGPDHA